MNIFDAIRASYRSRDSISGIRQRTYNDIQRMISPTIRVAINVVDLDAIIIGLWDALEDMTL